VRNISLTFYKHYIVEFVIPSGRNLQRSNACTKVCRYQTDVSV